eukprot:s954_g13.t1
MRVSTNRIKAAKADNIRAKVESLLKVSRSRFPTPKISHYLPIKNTSKLAFKTLQPRLRRRDAACGYSAGKRIRIITGCRLRQFCQECYEVLKNVIEEQENSVLLGGKDDPRQHSALKMSSDVLSLGKLS